jgi:hypothetical protein
MNIGEHTCSHRWKKRIRARYGRPKHPDDLMAHHCLGYAYRAKRDVWRLTNKAGDGVTVTPVGRCG